VRAFAGDGIPFDDAQSLPFEKAFYAGGSNDIRAWRFSTLGPGSMPNPDGIEQVGDAKLEGNIEIRSELFKFFEGAAFADFGNIWNRWQDINLDQFAVGAGLGLRLNFNFFIFRIDAAVPIYDPTRDDPDKWVYSHQTFEVSQINFNFGIGYPF
jgi:outer membrane protein assembly factor BamA